MLKRALIALLLAALVGAPPRVVADATDVELENGVRQAQEGDFEAAVVTLDAVVRKLTGQTARAKDLARAYTYLSIAYLGLSQEQTAKAKFLEAWRTDQDMSLSPREFPPKILEFFARAKEEAERNAPKRATTPTPAPAPPPRTPTPVASTPPAEKKGGSKTLLLIGAGAVAVGVGAAVALSGGDDPPQPQVTQPTGPISFRLTWTSVSDLDLHVGDPAGTEIFWNRTTSPSGGTYSGDIVCSPGTETINFSNPSPRGQFIYWANFSSSCSGPQSVGWTLVVSQGNSVLSTRTGSFAVGAETTRFTHVN